MGLSSALFSGISGLSTLGNAMTVIGDNIANVNTVGFKASRVTFQDVLSQTVATTAGTAQVGRGTSLADISASFAQGSFESTDCTTDLAIGGEGFFVVGEAGTENVFYTRAGEFRFDKDGNFVTPGGYVGRGWLLEKNETTGNWEDVGSITDIKLQSFTSSPLATDQITIITNLNSGVSSLRDDLAAVWKGSDTDDKYIGENDYEYQTTLKVYDSLGSTHDITIYYDKGTGSTYEYIVTCNPDEDSRTDVDLATGDNGYGILGKGILTFNAASGAIEGVTFSKFIGDGPGMDITTDPSDSTSTSTVTLYHDLNTETIAATGTYTFTMDHTADDAKTIGTDAISISWSDGAATGSFTIPSDYSAGSVLVDGADYNLPDGMELTFGAGALSGGDTFVAKILAGDANDLSSAHTWADISTTTEDKHLKDGYFTFNADFLGGTATDTSMDVKLDFGTNYTTSWVPCSLSTTQYSASSTTVFQSASGYGAGDLQSITVGTDGVITGQYSNGQVLSLYRVALAKFQSTQGLYKVGGNLFRGTRLSGDPITGKPGSSGLGSISPSSLEQSNVDIANEFVKMITTQRGFQANAKIITVTDQMLGELIALKR